MDKNIDLYKAAGHCIEAVRSLKSAGENEYSETLLNIGQSILDKIKTCELEAEKIKDYERRIKEKISE